MWTASSPGAVVGVLALLIGCEPPDDPPAPDGNLVSTDRDGGSAGTDLPPVDGPTDAAATLPEAGQALPHACSPAELVSSSQHCGVCGRSCRGAPCVDGLCQPEKIADGLEQSGAGRNFRTNFDGNYFYYSHIDWWKRISEIRGVSKTGARITAASIKPVVVPWDLMIQDGYAHYFTEVEINKKWAAWRIPTTGGGPPERIGSDLLERPDGFVGATGGFLYWRLLVLDEGRAHQHLLQRARPGGNSEVVATIPWSAYAVLDATGVYTSNQQENEIRFFPASGQPGSSFYVDPDPSAFIRLHALDGEAFYWSSRLRYVRMPRDKSRPPVIIAEESSPYFYPADNQDSVVAGDYVYLFGIDRISKVPRDGGPHTILARAPRTPEGWNTNLAAAVDDTHVYWLNFDGLWRTPN